MATMRNRSAMLSTAVVGLLLVGCSGTGAADDGGTGTSETETEQAETSEADTTPADGAEAPLVIGHRGAMGTSPENTVASIADAVDAGVHAIEIDVQLSSDGEPFLFHDSDGARTTNVAEVFPDRQTSPITTFTWDELSELDAGSHFDEEFAGEPIPHLRDVPEALGDSDVVINIEIKEPANSHGVEETISEMLETDEGWSALAEADRVIVSSFDPSSVAAFAALQPDVPVYPIGTIPDDGILQMWSEFATGVVTNHSTVHPSDIERVRDQDLELGVYTVNFPDEMRAAIDLEVDFIITDYPRELIEVLAQ